MTNYLIGILTNFVAIHQIKQQGKHYWLVFKWMMTSYYRREKTAFWIIQLLLGLTVALGLVWILGLIAGLNYLNDSSYLDQYQVSFLNNFFNLPVAVWILALSLAGILGAGISFLSFHIGVRSVIRYQIETIKNIFATIQHDKSHQWIQVVEDEPVAKTNQIIKMSVQMTGLVVRRLTRMLIPLITFLIAFVALIKLDGYLLSLLAPLAVLYLIALYFINRYAARNQVILSGLSKKTQRSLSELIRSILNRSVTHQQAATEKIPESGYQTFSDYRYKRRLAEIHVAWLNTLFLVLGSAVIILSVDFTDKSSFDWMHLIYFIVALRYAGSGLQQMASATVSFSRFLPEVELVYGLLTGNFKQEKNNHELYGKYSGHVLFLSRQFDEGIVAESILRYKYTKSQVIPLESYAQKSSSINEDCWVYSSKPTQFKQTVRRFAKQIDWVLIEINSNIKVYDNIKQFLDEFDPANYKQNTSPSDMLDDEEM